MANSPSIIFSINSPHTMPADTNPPKHNQTLKHHQPLTPSHFQKVPPLFTPSMLCTTITRVSCLQRGDSFLCYADYSRSCGHVRFCIRGLWGRSSLQRRPNGIGSRVHPCTCFDGHDLRRRPRLRGPFQPCGHGRVCSGA